MVISNDKLNEWLDELREERRCDDLAWESRQSASAARGARRMRFRNEILLKSLKEAKVEEYKEWLEGHLLDRKARISHVYDYPFPANSFFVALEDVELLPLHGTEAVHIIVPTGCEVTGKPGGCNLYFMRSFDSFGGWVPVFSDILSFRSEVANEKLEHARRSWAQEKRRRRLEEAEEEAQLRREIEWKQSYLMPRLQPATVCDYMSWLRGYRRQGGEETHVFDYPMPRGFYVAKRDIEMQPLFAARAVRIIVPAKFSISGDPGHSQIYLMKDYTLIGDQVPIYGDIHF